MPRRTLLLIFAAATLAIAVAMLVLPGREPRYQGRTLSQWLTQARTEITDPELVRMAPGEEPPQTISPSGRAAILAVRELGPRAVPELINWIKRPAPLLDDELRVFRNLVPGSAAKTVPARNRADLAVFGFGLLGPQASAAAPELTRLMKDWNVSQQTRESAMAALSQLGPAGLQPLLEAFASPSQPARKLVASYIGSMHHLGTDAPHAVAVLIGLLNDQDQQIAGRAATALGDLALEPVQAIPGLTNALKDPRPFVRVSAVNALRRYGSDAEPAIPALTETLNDSQLQVRMAATNAFSQIRPQN